MIAQQMENVNTQHLVVDSTNAGRRLDKFLVEKMPKLSRVKIQKMIKSGQVLLNGKPEAVHHFLKEGESVTIKSISNNRHSALGPEGSGRRELVSESPSKDHSHKLQIIYDDPDFLVVNKPAGLLVHEAPGHQEMTLADLILEKYPAIAKVGEDPSRPGLIHRLDREVSGLMVVAKTQTAFDHLKSQFKQRKVKKEYTALVYGQPAKPEAEIEFAIDRSVKGFKMAALPRQKQTESGGEGRRALTKFVVLKRFKDFSLLKLIPETGRTHQIRVHLNAYGLPIVGDHVYKPRKLKEKIKLDRIFLESSYLGFNDLAGRWKEFKLPLSEPLVKLLKKLGVDE